MDPNATLKLIAEYLDAGDRKNALRTCWDLQQWIAKGGFEPDWMKNRWTQIGASFFLGQPDAWRVLEAARKKRAKEVK